MGYAYLFRQDGTLSPDAGAQYVSYIFSLLSGPYLTTYDTQDGPNPENSTVSTLYYSHHFSDRWISDEIHVTVGGATGIDILDRHKAQFAPGNCVRSEDTFSDGEGAFVVNKSGPVRALRSYVGANSGPLTQREHVFYEGRQDIRTFLRVHAISGIMDFFDYSPEASGMTYYNDLNTSGVTIDGDPDSVAVGAIQWEMVSGSQGSLVIVGSLSTNIAGLSPTSYYLDDSAPEVTQCTGDAFAYGSSGVRVNQTIPCTDPALGCSNHLDTTRTIYYEAPGLSVAEAQALSERAGSPPSFEARPWTGSGDSDGDGIDDAVDNCPFAVNADQANTDSAPIDNGSDVAGDDVTVPAGDGLGDACDPDRDNDWMLDTGTNPVLGVPGEDGGCGSGPTNPLQADSDGDTVVDGGECLLGSDPNDPGSKPPGMPPGDADGDGLPASVEALFGSSDGNPDSDGDGISDGLEVKGWATSPASLDTDGDSAGGDGCEDDKEIASVNDDRQTNVLDVQVVARMAFGLLPSRAALDVNKDGAYNVLDVFLAAKNSTMVEPHGPC